MSAVLKLQSVRYTAEILETELTLLFLLVRLPAPADLPEHSPPLGLLLVSAFPGLLTIITAAA